MFDDERYGAFTGVHGHIIYYSAIYAHFSSKIIEIFKNAIHAHTMENLLRNPPKNHFSRLRHPKNTFPKN